MATEPTRYIVDETGEKKEVVISMEKYKALKEDLFDLARVAERREEESVSHDELKDKLMKNGLL